MKFNKNNKKRNKKYYKSYRIYLINKSINIIMYTLD